MDSHILLTFWGVRGSIASPRKHTVIFGGNTSCVSVATQDHIVILDAGSGIGSTILVMLYLKRVAKIADDHSVADSHLLTSITWTSLPKGFST